MPTTRATRWRQRDSAITRKGAFEVDPWDWDEPEENVSVQTSQAKASQPLKSAVQPLKPAMQQPSSPTSVAEMMLPLDGALGTRSYSSERRRRLSVGMLCVLRRQRAPSCGRAGNDDEALDSKA